MLILENEKFSEKFKMLIKIHKKTAQKEIEVSEGELVMLVAQNNFSENGNLRSATLGVFDGVKKYSHQGSWNGEHIQIKKSCRLFPSKLLGGIIVPIVMYQEDKYYDSKHIKEMYIEKEQIIKKLKESSVLKNYIEWIEKLEKPY